ncbi:hypothetical protein [Alkalimonas sp.]|uniref:hypothetical protein n=1 Tax=Alkalimonas sp. TaxID=1872453 RepID=UPI00263B8E63|nr:hypothetical protein [Alkalimonas sp.]MCC5826903.1 hypothetical protein [Alkalimonas sp.]
MSFTIFALLLSTSAISPGTGTLWLDGEAHPVEVTSCGVDTETAGAKGTLPDGSSVSVMLQRWPGMHALSVVYDNAQWVHRGPEGSEDAPELKRWVEDGKLKASGTVSVFPPIRQASMEVRFEGRCPG